MTSAQLEKPRTANMSVKLHTTDTERLRAIAISKKRTPHYLMKEAIMHYIEEMEKEQKAIALAQESLEHYKKT